MTHAPWIVALFALFVWWFSTGAILYVVRRADLSGGAGRAVAWALPLLIAGIVAALASRDMPTAEGAYLGFLGAVAIWGWIELAFLTGVITGPRPHPGRAGAAGWERFARAWGTIAYHEALLVLTLVLLVISVYDRANPVAAWTFGVLFLARISAKLNLYFGVPRINTEFLPSPLAHLPSHFRIARMTLMFPISVAALSVALAALIVRAADATHPTELTGLALIASFTALALLEHWLMVLPLPDARLWRWMLPEPKAPQ